jgi:acetyl-CoA C-acetyltransferase
MSEQAQIVIVDGARTPVGDFGGAFKDVPAHELGAAAARAALDRSGVAPEDVEEVVMGCIGQVGPDAFNARRVALSAGLAVSVPAYTVNRLCGSGLQAIWSAAMQIRWGGIDVALAGGDESMSRMPFYDFGPRGTWRIGDRKLVDGQAQDEFAVESQRRAASDEAQAAFAEEIVPVDSPRRDRATVSADEHPRPNTTIEALRGLRPAFKPDGTVTAGNASGINDGAGAVVVTHRSYADEHGLRPLASLEAVVTAALEPGLMGYAPVLALQRLFEQTGTTPRDIDTIELNEAFAAQAVAVIRDAKLDPAKVNPYGGAIALGHPVGATGAILSLRVAKTLARRDQELGIVTMCIGGGQALAAMYRRAA